MGRCCRRRCRRRRVSRRRREHPGGERRPEGGIGRHLECRGEPECPERRRVFGVARPGQHLHAASDHRWGRLTARDRCPRRHRRGRRG